MSDKPDDGAVAVRFTLPEGFSVDASDWYDTSEKVESEDIMIEEVRNFVRIHSSLDKEQFMRLAEWKSPRLTGHAKRNSEDEVREVTRIAFSARTERCRVTSLIGLAGVGWPMASVILHVCHNDAYPILDVRALGTLGLGKIPTYTYEFWNKYVGFCRNAAEEYRVSMRVFDRALFGWSKKTGAVAK
jgi:hypothetical protein